MSNMYSLSPCVHPSAAVAMRDDPSLVGKPVAIGGIGMISTANYEARKYGVRAAMPVSSVARAVVFLRMRMFLIKGAFVLACDHELSCVLVAHLKLCVVWLACSFQNE